MTPFSLQKRLKNFQNVFLSTLWILLFCMLPLAPVQADGTTNIFIPLVRKDDAPYTPVEVLNNYSTVASSSNLYIYGEIVNNTPDTITSMRVPIDFFDGNGHIVGVANGNVPLSHLRPNEKTCFSTQLAFPTGWQTIHFEKVQYAQSNVDLPDLNIADSRSFFNAGNGLVSSTYDIGGIIRNNEPSATADLFLQSGAVGTLYTSSGKVLGCESGYHNRDYLPPSEVTGFQIYFWDSIDYSGVTSYHLQPDGLIAQNPPTPLPPGAIVVSGNYSINGSDRLTVSAEIVNNTEKNINPRWIYADVYDVNGHFLDSSGSSVYLPILKPHEKTCVDFLLNHAGGLATIQFEYTSVFTEENPPALTIIDQNDSIIDGGFTYQIIGVIRNDDQITTQHLSVVGTLYYSSGKVAGCKSGQVNNLTLAPMETTGFSIPIYQWDYANMVFSNDMYSKVQAFNTPY